jgi:hypothetical protein
VAPLVGGNTAVLPVGLTHSHILTRNRVTF